MKNKRGTIYNVLLFALGLAFIFMIFLIGNIDSNNTYTMEQEWNRCMLYGNIMESIVIGGIIIIILKHRNKK